MSVNRLKHEHTAEYERLFPDRKDDHHGEGPGDYRALTDRERSFPPEGPGADALGPFPHPLAGWRAVRHV